MFDIGMSPDYRSVVSEVIYCHNCDEPIPDRLVETCQVCGKPVHDACINDYGVCFVCALFWETEAADC